MLEGKEHGVLLLQSLQCSQRELFTHLWPKNLASRFNAFRNVLFCLAAFMLISFIFSYLESFFAVFYLSFYFLLATGRSACEDQNQSGA